MKSMIFFLKFFVELLIFLSLAIRAPLPESEDKSKKVVGLKNSIGGAEPGKSSAIAAERKNNATAGEMLIRANIKFLI